MNDMTVAYALLIGVILLAFFMHSKKKAKRGIGPLATTPRGWHIEHSEGLPTQPTPQGAGWVVDIPLKDQGFLGSIKLYDIPKMRVGGVWVLKGRVEGAGVLARQFPERQATVTFIVQRRGDNEMMPEYRWYSNAMIDLKEGSYEISIPLTSDNMKPVLGKNIPEDFAAAIADAWNIQLGFGSAGGRAHSVHSTTPAKFYMDSLTYSD